LTVQRFDDELLLIPQSVHDQPELLRSVGDDDGVMLLGVSAIQVAEQEQPAHPFDADRLSLV